MEAFVECSVRPCHVLVTQRAAISCGRIWWMGRGEFHSVAADVSGKLHHARSETTEGTKGTVVQSGFKGVFAPFMKTITVMLGLLVCMWRSSMRASDSA